MARRKAPESEAVAFFETAPLDAAVTLFNIAKGIIQRRQATRETKARPASTRPVNHERRPLLADQPQA
jgi:hypothetical protein